MHMLILLLICPATVGAASVNIAALSAPVECKWSNNGHTYDLTALENPTVDYAIVSTDSKGNTYTYYYNFCAGTTGRSGTGIYTCTKGQTAVCQNNPANASLVYSLGALRYVVWSEYNTSPTDSGIELRYPRGGTGDRNSIVKIKCDPSVDTVYFESVTKKPNDVYEIKAVSKLACRGSNPGPPSPPSPPPPPPLPRCKHTDAATGLTYDLTKLQLAGPYKVKTTETPQKRTYVHSIGVCNTAGPCDDPRKDPTQGAVAACQTLLDPDGKPVPDYAGSNGYLRTMEIESIGKTVFGQQGVAITYTGSAEIGCQTDANPRGVRKTVVEVLCSATPIAPDPILKYISEDPKCSYNYVLESVQACGAKRT